MEGRHAEYEEGESDMGFCRRGGFERMNGRMSGFERMKYASLLAVALALAGLEPVGAQTVPHPSFDYAFRWVAPFDRELIIRQTGQEPVRYRVVNCGLGSSETGVFPVFGGIDRSPVVAVLCRSVTDGRSLHVFAPREDRTGPVFSLQEKRSLTAAVSHVGLLVAWRETKGGAEANDIHIWEPNGGMGNAQEFRDARDAALGKTVVREGALPEGLKAGDYVMAEDPDLPLRLGPSLAAPWFERAGDRLLIHLQDGIADELEEGHWTVDDWRRVCPLEGDCGYVPAGALTVLQ